MEHQSTNSWEIEVFHDGDCPLCAREIANLRKRDLRGRILFTDIAAADFDASVFGKDHDTFMKNIQGRLPDGTWLSGVEVFRRLYSAIGFGPLVALTRIPGVSNALDWGYARWAENRLRLTGRCEDGVCEAQEIA